MSDPNDLHLNERLNYLERKHNELLDMLLSMQENSIKTMECLTSLQKNFLKHLEQTTPYGND